MNLKHILLKYQYEAEDVLRLLKNGKDFSELAKKFSQCASSTNGGDLGKISEKSLDTDFLEAAQILKPGQTSGVVKTRFGYHIIQRY